MIILEGSDNTGKTTLQQAILKRYPSLVPGYKQERPPEDRQEYMDRLWSFLGKDQDHTLRQVFDRFYFSELVYGPLLRGKVIFTEAENEMLVRLIRRHEPLVIYCYRTPDQILASFHERKQLEGVEERVARIVEDYDRAFTKWVKQDHENFIIYDYENPVSVNLTWCMIDRYLRYRDNEVGCRPARF